MKFLIKCALFATIYTFSRAAPTQQSAIDLGYAKHVPTIQLKTDRGHLVNVYKNIRFAQPPTGELRFKLPQTPPPSADQIQDGNLPVEQTTCVSSVPPYAPFPGVNGTTFGHEDCLFLDVYVPEGVNSSDTVPVIHWLYGSAYAFGSKDTELFNPIGLFDELLTDDLPFIFIASNYRIGLYGWMSSPFEDMDVNVGFHDGLVAAEWTQKYISRFGGDPSRITIMGQSAGAGMIEMMLILRGGRGTLPFQRAILSSADYPQRRNATERRQEVYDSVLNQTNCSSLACLQQTDEKLLLNANDHLVNHVPSLGGGGTFGPGIGFGPVVDGKYIPDLSQALFRAGQFHRIEGVIVANMGNEASTLSSDQDMPELFPSIVRRIIPSASNQTIANIESQYQYPTNHTEELAWEWTGDAVFFCHSYGIAEAMPNVTRRYIMTVPPATHGEDVYLYFYINETVSLFPETFARPFQKALGEFIYGESILVVNQTEWDTYREEAMYLNISSEGYKMVPTSEYQLNRCKVVDSALLDCANGI